MSSIRERLLSNNTENYSTIRNRLGLKDENYYNKSTQNSNEQTKTNTSSLKILKKSDAFDDGYQLGDITKTIGATVGDLATNVGKGFLNTVEGVADAGQYLLADVAKGLSKVKLLDAWDKNARSWLKEKANALEENAKFDSTGAIFGENEKESDNLLKKGWTEKLNKNSVSDNMFDSVAQGVGNVAAMAGTAYVGGQALGTGTTTTSFLNSFSSAFGNAKSEAYKNGADNKTALETAIVSGFSEAISEQFFDALPGMKVEGWGSKLTGKIANSVSKHFGSKAGKATLKVLDSIGEGAEEVISNALNAVGNDIVHYIDNDYDYGMEEQTGNIFKDTKNAVFSEDSLASFISASLTSAIINGGNTFITEKQKKDIIKAYASDNNITIDEATNIFNSIVETNTSNQLNEKTDFNDKVELEKEETAKLLNLIRSNNIDLKKYSSEQKRFQEQLANIQNQNTNVEVTDIVDTTNVNNNDTQKSAPTVQDIVEMENKKNVNNNIAPVDVGNSNINSNLQMVPLVSDFEVSNTNISTQNNVSNMAKISPKILEDIKGFKLGEPNVESYKGSYIKTMMNEVGIKVPIAINYVNEVKSDMSYTTTMKLNEEQNTSIKKALQELKNIDVNSINNINYSIPIGNYKYVKSSNSNINELRRTASMYLNNTARTNNTIKLLENIIKDRNYTIRFNPNITNEQGVSVDGKISVENGQTIIELNPNSSNYIEFLVIHEITHDIATKEMKVLILDYAKQDPEFEKSLETLKERYKTDDVSDEVVADVCGELFGNREFIQSVVEKKPNIFKKILNNIRKLAEKIKGTGANEYVSFVENLKEKWEEAYYSNQSNLTDTKYMITSVKGMQNGINVNNRYQDIKNRYEIALKLSNNNYSNEDIRKITGWFKDNKGNLKFEISDRNTFLIKKPMPNTNYKLSDIFEAKTLYEMYPELKNITIEFKNLKGKNGRYSFTNKKMILNNKLLNNLDNLKGTLLHEIQHYIQYEENLPTGTTILFGNEQYANSLGEIEAANTKERRNLTVDERKEIIPESSKENPVHPNRNAILNHKRNAIEKIAEKLYNLIGDKSNELFEENDIETSKMDFSKNSKKDSNGLGFNGRYDVKELDNGSFPLNKSQISTKEWDNYLKENFPSSGTKTKMSEMLAPTREYFEGKINNKILNPNEISQLKLEDASTTPPLFKNSNKNKVQDGESHFAKNIKDKTNMLTIDQKAEILSEEEVRYYDKVTNRESLEKAFEKLNNGGSAETLRWFKQDSKNVDATDVAEGWILMKQYSDNGDYDSMVEVAKKMREIGTTAGQTVQAFNILSRMTPEGMVKYAQSELSEAYDRMIKNKSKEWIDKHREDFDLKPDEVKFIMDTMQEISEIENLNFRENTINKLKSELKSATNIDDKKVINYLIKTLEKSDLEYYKKVKLTQIQKLMTDKLPPQKGAGIKSWMRISMLFNPKTQVRNVAGNALIMPVNSFGDLFSSYADKLISKKTGVRTTGNTNIKAMLKGIKKGAYEATNDYKMGINTKDMDGNRFEISDGKSFNDKKLIGKALNRTESLLNYVMDVGDRVFSEAAFENSLQNQMVLNNTTEITQEMIDIAHQEALSRTWNDNNNYTRFVLGIRKGMNRINIRGYGLGDALIPFAKTPANLTKAIVDYSPAGVVSTITKGINLKRALSNGQYTASMQHDFVQSLGKATAGTMLYVLGIALAKAGITSGDSDDDKDTANFLKNALGVSSYSIKIGNKSFTYDWAQPIAAPLSITANVVNSKENDSQALLEAIVGSLDTAGSILLEQSFLQSINDVLSDNDGVVSGIINEVLELPARAVPTFSKQIADLVDGTQRTSFEYGKPIKSAVNSIVAKIPFASKTLAPSVDTMGREIQKYGGKNNIFNVFLNPANVNTDNISKSAEEIYRLYKETGETSVMPRVAPYYINQKGEKITMTNEQRVNYQKTSGKIIEESIEKLLKSSSYSEMSDKEKSEVITDIVNYSYNIAKNEVLGIELSDTYQKAYDYSKIGDIGDYYAFKESIDDTNKDTKKSSITNFLIDSNLNDKQLAFLYGSYYSSEETLDNLIKANIPIKEFIKFNSQTFESDYYDNGKTISNSRKKKVINYINSLNLSVAQKAILIKMEYSSYNSYNSQIVNYINKMDYSKYEKACILKQIGFDDYDSYIIEIVNKKNISTDKKEEILEDLGFKIKNGKVYSK